IEYAPKLPTDRRHDIPEEPSSRYTAVFYLFGKADVFPFFAIHDEDALEFPYTLQTSGQPIMLSRLRSRNLLFIGCNLADWLSRFFLRLSNSERLFSDQRSKKEFLVGEETSGDPNFVFFLERFSPDSRFYPGPAAAFVADLHRRWGSRNPAAITEMPEEPAQDPSRGTIFISYHSPDIAAASTLRQELNQIGGDVSWFDKTDLKPGDKWEQVIRSAIQRCSLFLPLLSANTEKQTDAYFHVEWSEAVARLPSIVGRKFI